MGGAVGWTTALSSGCGSVKYEDIYVEDYGDGLDAGRGLGRWLTATTRSVRTRPWAMRHRRMCILIPAPTEPSRPNGKRCSRSRAGNKALLDGEANSNKRLEIRPPAAVELGTLRKRRGRTGGARHGSFSLFERVEKSRMNNRQTEVYLTTDGGSRNEILRSVV